MHADDDEHQSPDTNGRAQQFSLTEGQECVTTTDRDGQHPEQHVTTDSPDPQQQPKVLAAEEGRSQLMLQIEVRYRHRHREPCPAPPLPRVEQGDSSITIRFGGLGLGLAISLCVPRWSISSLSAPRRLHATS